MKSSIAIAALVVLAGVTAARAQMTIDVAKITCREILFDKFISPKTDQLALWLSGYYNAKRNNTLVDINAMQKNKDKVEDYCRLNQDVTVMDAVAKVLGNGQ